MRLKGQIRNSTKPSDVYFLGRKYSPDPYFVGRELQPHNYEVAARVGARRGGQLGSRMDKVRSNTLVTPPAPRADTSAQPAADRTRDEAGTAEKRGQVRYPVSAAAEIVEARSRTRLSARAADISLSGCYLDAINLFPVGAVVGLRLTNEARAFECEARVTYSLPGMGMGLAFTKMSASQAAILRNWIAELAGQPNVETAVPLAAEAEFENTGPRPGESQSASGWQDVLYELVSLLQRKGILGETEANTLRSRIAR